MNDYLIIKTKITNIIEEKRKIYNPEEAQWNSDIKVGFDSLTKYEKEFTHLVKEIEKYPLNHDTAFIVDSMVDELKELESNIRSI